jgi:hypothetical protein
LLDWRDDSEIALLRPRGETSIAVLRCTAARYFNVDPARIMLIGRVSDRQDSERALTDDLSIQALPSWSEAVVYAIAEGVETPLPKLRLVLEESWQGDNNIYVEVEHETTMADCVALIAARLNMSMQDLQVYIENYDDWEGSNYWPVDSLDTTTIWEHVKGSTFTIEYSDQIIHINYRTNAGQGGGDNGEGTNNSHDDGDDGNNGPPTPPDSGAPQDGDTPQDGGTSPAGDGADGDTPQDGGTSPAGDGANESDDDEFANAWPVGSGFPNPNDLEFDPSLDLDEEPEGLTYNCDPDTNIIIKTITGKVDQQKFNMRASLAEIKTYVEKELLVPQEQQIIIIGRERVVDFFMKGGDKSHMNLEELGLENNSMIFLTYEMRGGGSKGVKKVIDKRGTAPAGAGARKKKTNPQDDDEDENEDEDSNQDGDDMEENESRKRSGKVATVNNLIKECKDMLNYTQSARGFGTDMEGLTTEINHIIERLEDGDDDLFMKLLTAVPERSLMELASAHITSTRNTVTIAKGISDRLFEKHMCFLNEKKTVCETLTKLLKKLALLMYISRFCSTSGTLDHWAFETAVTKAVSTQARASAAPRAGGLMASLLGRL